MLSICFYIVLRCLIIFAIISVIECNYVNPHYETITVTEKNVNPGKNSEKWLIYTEEEVYCINDLLFVGFFTSSDVYNTIQPGKTYKVYVSGRRIPFLSGYKVIREAKEVK